MSYSGKNMVFLAVGEDLIECFDAIDTLSKSAQIYFSARMAGYEPAGMTDKQLDDLVPGLRFVIGYDR